MEFSRKHPIFGFWCKVTGHRFPTYLSDYVSCVRCGLKVRQEDLY